MNTMPARLLTGLLAVLSAPAVLGASPPLAPPAPPPAVGAPADLDQQLAAARQRLEQAADEVARLSTQFGDGGGPPGGRRMIIQTIRAPRAMLGLQIEDAPEGGGARVAEVSPGGPGAEAGVRAGDVVRAVDGTDVRDARGLLDRVRDAAPEQKLRLQLLRDGKPLEVAVAPRPLPPGMGPGMLPGTEVQAFRLAVPRGPDGQERPGRAGGMLPPPFRDLELATLSPRLGAYFGAKSGVLVVRSGAAAGSLNLQDGDVITTIDGREPTSAAHATRILRSYQPGEKVQLRLLRDRKPVSLDVTLPR